MQSDHACSTLPITIKSEDSDTLAEGDRKQLGLDSYPPTDKFIRHAMIKDPAMHMDANMFIVTTDVVWALGQYQVAEWCQEAA